MHEYVQLVEGHRENGKVRQRVVATLGRLDELKASGQLDRWAGAFARLDPPPLGSRREVGPLLVVAHYLRHLGLVELIDRALPMRGRSLLTHGEVIAALVANRLAAPAPLYDVADLSSVWIQAQVYEDDLPFLPTEQHETISSEQELTVVATTRAYPNEEFHGKLTFIYPHVDQNTRTMTVRTEVANDDQQHLVPGITATVGLQIEPRSIPSLASAVAANSDARAQLELGKVLAVPVFSVIETGEEKALEAMPR